MGVFSSRLDLHQLREQYQNLDLDREIHEIENASRFSRSRSYSRVNLFCLDLDHLREQVKISISISRFCRSRLHRDIRDFLVSISITFESEFLNLDLDLEVLEISFKISISISRFTRAVIKSRSRSRGLREQFLNLDLDLEVNESSFKISISISRFTRVLSKSRSRSRGSRE